MRFETGLGRRSRSDDQVGRYSHVLEPVSSSEGLDQAVRPPGHPRRHARDRKGNPVELLIPGNHPFPSRARWADETGWRRPSQARPRTRKFASGADKVQPSPWPNMNEKPQVIEYFPTGQENHPSPGPALAPRTADYPLAPCDTMPCSRSCSNSLSISALTISLATSKVRLTSS